MLKGIISLIKPVIAALEKYHDLLESISVLLQINEQFKLDEKLHKLILFIEWSRLYEQVHTVLLLIGQYF